jgi:hypothetical protein
MPEVALAWGSKSHKSTRFPRYFSAAARLTQVVVFPTPPFWFTIATIFATFPTHFLSVFLFSISHFRAVSIENLQNEKKLEKNVSRETEEIMKKVDVSRETSTL